MSDGLVERYGKVVLVPALITLAVTLLRLVGELQNWSPTFFSREAGGGGAVVGIVWLVIVFGISFAWKLAGTGQGPGSLGRAFGVTVLALAIMPVLGFGAGALGLDPTGPGTLAVYVLGSLAAIVVGLRAWPELGRTLLVYGFAARVPVAILMLPAILGSWGTHYDAPPPGFPEMNPWAKWVLIGLIPQMTIWIAFTVVVGSLFGLAAVALFRRRSPVPA
jgi:hypothetical protein